MMTKYLQISVGDKSMVFQGTVYNQEWSQPQVQLPFKGGAEAETGKQVCEAS